MPDEIEFIPDEEGIPQELAGKIKKLKEESKRCETERKEYLEGWQRAKADFINFKKDEGKRFEDMARFVTASIVEEFLPVLDSFDLALAHGVPKEVDPVRGRPAEGSATSPVRNSAVKNISTRAGSVEISNGASTLGRSASNGVEKGIMLIRSQFEDVLRKRGIEEITVGAGDPFDPAKHESVGELKSEHPPGTIADVVQKGYVFRERVMRPVRVRLAKEVGSLEKENAS